MNDQEKLLNPHTSSQTNPRITMDNSRMMDHKMDDGSENVQLQALVEEQVAPLVHVLTQETADLNKVCCTATSSTLREGHYCATPVFEDLFFRQMRLLKSGVLWKITHRMSSAQDK